MLLAFGLPADGFGAGQGLLGRLPTLGGRRRGGRQDFLGRVIGPLGGQPGQFVVGSGLADLQGLAAAVKAAQLAAGAVQAGPQGDQLGAHLTRGRPLGDGGGPGNPLLQGVDLGCDLGFRSRQILDLGHQRCRLAFGGDQFLGHLGRLRLEAGHHVLVEGGLAVPLRGPLALADQRHQTPGGRTQAFRPRKGVGEVEPVGPLADDR